MRFLNSVTVPKNVKGGTLWDFLTSIVLQNVEKMKEGPFGAIQKVSKKSRIVPKKSGAMGILSVISRFWMSVLFLLFVLDAFLRFELLRFDVVEQINKKLDLTRLKKLPTVRVGHIFYKNAPTKKDLSNLISSIKRRFL